MPEASVHEQSDPILRKHQVRMARESTDVHAVPQSQAMQLSPQHHLRYSAPLPDSAHQPTSVRGPHRVGHRPSAKLLRISINEPAVHGPNILARTLSTKTTGAGSKPFAYGNAWQYHSQSDRHSKVACWGLTLDLLMNCPLLRTHIADGKVGLGINHELRDFRNNKKKKLDMVLCRIAASPAKTSLKRGPRGAHDFAALSTAYGLDLEPSDRAALAKLPILPIAGVATVLVATEAKAAMTAFLKARPRLKDELTSSHQTVHGDNESAIAAGLVLVNGASSFVSSSLNKHDLSRTPAIVSKHRQPEDAEKIVTGLRDIQRRSSPKDAGFDALGVIVIDCRNDGSSVTCVTGNRPAPTLEDDFDYGRFVHRVAHLYATRFSGL